MPVKKGKKKGKGKEKKHGKTINDDKEIKGIPPDTKLQYALPLPLPYGESLLKVLRTHCVDEKEIHNEKVSTKILEQLTPTEIRDLKFVFETFDSNSDGYILGLELKQALRVLGFSVSKNRAMELATGCMRQGFVSFTEYLTFVIEQQGEGRDDLDEILKGFEFFDFDKTGNITIRCLKRACRETGVQLSQHELVEMIEEADYNGDGMVDKGEFVRIMRKTSLY